MLMVFAIYILLNLLKQGGGKGGCSSLGEQPVYNIGESKRRPLDIRD